MQEIKLTQDKEAIEKIRQIFNKIRRSMTTMPSEVVATKRKNSLVFWSNTKNLCSPKSYKHTSKHSEHNEHKDRCDNPYFYMFEGTPTEDDYSEESGFNSIY